MLDEYDIALFSETTIKSKIPKIIELYRQGMNMQSISVEVLCSATFVSKIIKNYIGGSGKI